MPRLRFPKPITCEQIHGFFPALLKEELDAERRGRVEGHLFTCEACAVALAEAIEQALARGDIPQPDVPKLPLPAAVSHVSGHGIVKGWMWEVVKREGCRAVAMVQRAEGALHKGLMDQAASWGMSSLIQALHHEDETYVGEDFGETKRRWQAAGELWTNLERRLQASLSLWQMLTEPVGAFMGPHLGGGSQPSVVHLNVDWQPTGAETVVDVENGPAMTMQGEFLFTVASDEIQLAGQRLICTVQLIEGEAIRFETETQPTPDTRRWRATFRATGLPAKTLEGDPLDQAVPIPLEMIEIYAVSQAQQS